MIGLILSTAGPPFKKGGGRRWGQRGDGGGGAEGEGGRRPEWEDKVEEGGGGKVKAVGEECVATARFGTRTKKTPTQLRRERKKRQKERERRQEKMGSEESDAQVSTPPPINPTSHEETHSPPPAPKTDTTISTIDKTGLQNTRTVGTLISLSAKVVRKFRSLEPESQTSPDSSMAAVNNGHATD